ncbi:MAG TPA: acyloxyacyl hydrolase [Terriglobales bacterium]|nr:acyloxyacyl hydrolase [Terriglobales bacterium]
MIRRLPLVSLLILLVSPAQAQSKPEARDFRTEAFRTGGNEYEIWSGYSPTSLEWIGKTEARRLFMVGLGWRRVILAGDSVAWKYTGDVVPVVLVSQPTVVGSGIIFTGTPPNVTFVGCDSPQLVHETVNDLTGFNLGPCQHASRRTTYGFSLEPIGFDLNFRRRHRFQPVTGINGGFALFTRDVPISNSNSFNFTFSLRGGLQIFTSESRSITLGYRYHHTSNADTGNPFNPGIDSNFMYVQYSLHR